MQFYRLRLIAEAEEGSEIPEEPEEIDDDEPEVEVLKYANRSGSYALCTRAGLGKLLRNIFHLFSFCIIYLISKVIVL